MLKVSKKYLIILFLAAIAYYIQGEELFNLFFYVTLICFIAAFFYIIAIKKCVSVIVCTDSNVCSINDECNISLLIDNKAIVPVPFTLIKNDTMCDLDKNYSGNVIWLGIRKKLEIDKKIKFIHRGVYDFGNTDIENKDFLFIFREGRRINNPCKVKVYPRLYPLNENLIEFNGIADEHIKAISALEDISTVRDVRKYTAGDNLKKVHWKVSARHGELYVKNFDTSENKSVALFINMNQEDFYSDNNTLIEENCISFSASFVNFFVKRNIEVDMFINNSITEHSIIKSKMDFKNLMEYFVENKSEGNTQFYYFIKANISGISKSKTLCIVTPSISTGIEETLILVKKLGYSCILFYYESGSTNLTKLNNLKKYGISCIDIRSSIM